LGDDDAPARDAVELADEVLTLLLALLAAAELPVGVDVRLAGVRFVAISSFTRLLLLDDVRVLLALLSPASAALTVLGTAVRTIGDITRR
jgi:hypothetical protein